MGFDEVCDLLNLYCLLLRTHLAWCTVCLGVGCCLAKDGAHVRIKLSSVDSLRYESRKMTLFQHSTTSHRPWHREQSIVPRCLSLYHKQMKRILLIAERCQMPT